MDAHYDSLLDTYEDLKLITQNVKERLEATQREQNLCIEEKSRIEVSIDTDGKWCWRLIAGKNDVLLKGDETYQLKEDVIKAVGKIRYLMGHKDVLIIME